MVERTHLCRPFVNRTALFPKDLFALIVCQGSEHKLTNLEILRRSLAIGQQLKDTGIASGSLIIIILPHGADLYPSFLGCMIYGFIPSFLPPLTVKQDPAAFQRSITALFDRILPSAVITSVRNATQIPAGDYLLMQVEEVGSQSFDNAPETALKLLDSLPEIGSATAFLQHSSGTTGLKKGVMLSHTSVTEQIQIYSDSIGIERGDIIASWLPLYHDMGLITSFLLPLLRGNLVISLDALEWVSRPTMLLDYMERYRVSFVWMPDFAFHHIIRAARNDNYWDLAATKAIINCSEPCRSLTFQRFSDKFAKMGISIGKLHVCYAMAENVFAVSQTAYNSVARHGEETATRRFLSCGQVIKGVQIDIRSPCGTSVSIGELGEICIRSTTLFEGYFRQPDATSKRIKDGWYCTNDLGCIEGGELFVLGRVDDLLIVNGKNIFAHEIEDVLSDLPGVAPGRLLAISEYDDRVNATRLTILCETQPDEENTIFLESEIRRVTLAQTGIFPGVVSFLPRGFLVKTSSGKLARADSVMKYQMHSCS